ncbi:NTPase [Thermofilum pendens]|uniref:Nucleoside-triphosphatase THEP1 n=1 Tax=Thermofilum pendens (strain DSM 2475 / Hrk 5) TaxID=368408 RepID=NTPTH_THEPD|nr:NTPase [Thermofilum pendens]A1RYX5.1 RecName: Full=Nucleoside-triphosphatase THEP1; Short=NTPase THEP1; AltName: Full=Nucleoside triphosphate phosphohydrolase [Thermofilum pendens Hrk 5]ABL78405.1 protein of unknown function DUF265 [Thermofilum pendens Hrk 5]
MAAKNFLLTGRPGIGKTTCVVKTAELLVSRGVKVGGMVTHEVREGGSRVGFKVRDLLTGREGFLAKVGAGAGPRVGKYVVHVEELEAVGVGAILRAVSEAQVVVIDEIGPMELYSPSFLPAVLKALDSDKPVLATIHERESSSGRLRGILERGDVKLYTVTLQNRDLLPPQLAREIASLVAR